MADLVSKDVFCMANLKRYVRKVGNLLPGASGMGGPRHKGIAWALLELCVLYKTAGKCVVQGHPLYFEPYIRWPAVPHIVTGDLSCICYSLEPPSTPLQHNPPSNRCTCMHVQGEPLTPRRQSP